MNEYIINKRNTCFVNNELKNNFLSKTKRFIKAEFTNSFGKGPQRDCEGINYYNE